MRKDDDDLVTFFWCAAVVQWIVGVWGNRRLCLDDDLSVVRMAESDDSVIQAGALRRLGPAADARSPGACHLFSCF